MVVYGVVLGRHDNPNGGEHHLVGPQVQALRGLLAALLVLGVLLVSGCGIPKDSRGSLDAATGGVLRVGVSANPPWTQVDAAGTVSGTEAELVERYAATIGAEIDWQVGSEAVLADAIHRADLDIFIAGLTSDSPWTDKVALTRPYATAQASDGSSVKMVMAVPMGENALQVSLERFLAEQ